MNFHGLLTSGLLLLCLMFIPLPRAESVEPSALWKKDALTFSGFSWDVKTGYYSPGENHWSEHNVWVDDEDRLHLWLTNAGDAWQCAEIATGTFGYGLYRFYLDGPVDLLDKNAVLGLFLYPGPQLPYRANAEIDIEFARWGQADAPIGNFTVTPTSWRFPLAVQGELSTHQFLWLPDRVEFSSYHGHGEPTEKTLLAHWVFRGDDQASIPDTPLQLHINYWLFQGKAPAQNRQPEIVIRKFIFQPAPSLLSHQRVLQETE